MKVFSQFFLNVVMNFSLLVFSIILSPLLIYNHFVFRINKRRKPLADSPIVKIINASPCIYDFSILFWNFPIQKKIYSPIQLDPDKKILQIGCGTGLLNTYCKNKKMKNLDLNLAYLQYGKKHKRFDQYDCASAYALPYPDGSFDTIIFSRCFHHLLKPKKAFKEACRALNSNGEIIIFDPVSDAKHPFRKRVINTELDGIICDYHTNYMVEEVQACLPSDLYIYNYQFVKSTTLTNYNILYPHTDAVITIKKQSLC